MLLTKAVKTSHIFGTMILFRVSRSSSAKFSNKIELENGVYLVECVVRNP